MDLDHLLAISFESQASDLHLTPGQAPLIRVHGDLARLDLPPLPPAELESALFTLMRPGLRQRWQQGKNCDFHLSVALPCQGRVHVYRQFRGMAAAIRLIPLEVPRLSQLGLPTALETMAMAPQGLVLISGASGSGKSSALAAMLDHRNASSRGHILTLEDPIEFLHQSKQSLVTQCELDPDDADFSQALKCALRQDPDVITVAEMRDAASIRLALEAAQTGHLVLATLHARSAREAVTRIVSAFAPEAQEAVRCELSLALQAVLALTLVKQRDGQGRLAAHEILIATHAVRNLIRENRLAQIESLQQSGQSSGMHTLQQSLRQLLDAGLISAEEAGRQAGPPVAPAR
jgi:twitching motility protein PilT